MTIQKSKNISVKPLLLTVTFTVLILFVLGLSFERQRLDVKLNNLNDILQTISDENKELTVKLDSLTESNEDIKKLVTENNSMIHKYGLNYLNQSQLNNLVYVLNNTPTADYTWTLLSIAWKESRAGLWPVNIGDPSCGMFHNKIINVLKREDIEDTRFNRNLYCAKLINDIDFALKHATLELDHWTKVHKGDWRKIWASYNGGNKGNPKYAQEIAELVTLFRGSNIGNYLQTQTEEQLYTQLN